MVKESDKVISSQATHDSLISALESIKGLLQKNDEELSAVGKRTDITRSKTEKNALNSHNLNDLEIPVLNDVVSPTDYTSPITSQIDEALKLISPNTIANRVPGESAISQQADPQVMLDYLDTLQSQIEKILRDSLMKSIVTIEASLKKSLTSEIDAIRKLIKKNVQ